VLAAFDLEFDREGHGFRRAENRRPPVENVTEMQED
jgi:hypothetical protein